MTAPGGRSTVGSWSTETALAAADECLARLRSIGVGVRPGNRLQQSRDLIRQIRTLNVVIGHGDPVMLRQLQEAGRTVFQQYMIVSQVSSAPEEDIRRKLRKMLGGPLVPVDGRPDPARDAQAELLVGLLFRAAGYYVRIGGPDLVIRQRGQSFGIAVKRVSSDRQYRKRVRKAQDQLVSSDLDGVLVLVVDSLVSRLQAEGKELAPALEAQTENWFRYIEQRPGIDRVRAVIAVANSFALLRPGLRHVLGVTTHFYGRFVSEDDPQSLRRTETMVRSMRDAMIAGLQHIGAAT